jgi:hypothetical protein
MEKRIEESIALANPQSYRSPYGQEAFEGRTKEETQRVTKEMSGIWCRVLSHHYFCTVAELADKKKSKYMGR